MTHGQLVDRAMRWLKVTKRCRVVFREHYMFNEIPDALGYRGPYSLVVECKVSRADFLRDLKKPSRRAYEQRPALMCWYMVAETLNVAEAIVLEQADLPDGWGLLVVDRRGIVKERISPRQFYQPRASTVLWNDDRTPEQFRAEIERLTCDIRRYHAQGLHYEPIRKLHSRRHDERRDGLVAPSGEGLES